MTIKDTNPKDALGIKKAPLHAVPCQPLYEVGLAMMEGGRKYGTHNYRSVGVRASVYYDAVMRHITAWWEGEDIDPESGIHHLMKAAACEFVYRDAEIMGNVEDDRPIRHPNKLDMNKFNGLAANIIKKYPDCVKPFTHSGTLKPKPITDPAQLVPAAKISIDTIYLDVDGVLADFVGGVHKGFVELV
jgi:hypothetical protein